MKILFAAILSIFICSPSVWGQGNPGAMRDVGDKCLAAFQRDPTAIGTVPPRAFCLCVAQQVATSSDDRRSATDRAGNLCLQMMSSPKTFGGGLARGQNESCLRDSAILSYYPNTYRQFCSCLGASFAEEIISNKPLSKSSAASLANAIEESRERAVQTCVKAVPR